MNCRKRGNELAAEEVTVNALASKPPALPSPGPEERKVLALPGLDGRRQSEIGEPASGAGSAQQVVVPLGSERSLLLANNGFEICSLE